MRRFGPVLLAALVLLACRRPPAADPTYLAAIDAAARAKRLSALTAEDGWLSLVARELLEPGENVVGSDPSAALVLEDPGIPARACAFDLRPDGTVVLRAGPGAPVAVNGAPPTEAPLVPEGEGTRHDVVTVGRVRISLFAKDGRFLVRARDSESPRRTGFTGLKYFPVDPAYRVEGAYEAYEAPREVDVPSSRGPARKALAPGVVRFALAGREYQLEPTVESPEDEILFFVFSDATAPKESYGGGRFLHAKRAESGGVEGRPRFQPRREPALLAYPIRELPSGPPEEHAAREGRGGGEGARRSLTSGRSGSRAGDATKKRGARSRGLPSDPGRVGRSVRQSFGPAAITSGAHPSSNFLKFSMKRAASDR